MGRRGKRSSGLLGDGGGTGEKFLVLVVCSLALLLIPGQALSRGPAERYGADTIWHWEKKEGQWTPWQPKVFAEAAGEPELTIDAADAGEPLEPIADPLEPLNRAFFTFNDKLYFWVLKPVARGYGWLVPEVLRVAVRNFFDNLATPVRFVNCLLQGKGKGAGYELLRFTVNTTAGFMGFEDVAAYRLGIRRQREDLGQTMGVYGLGPGIYINWPILGPSSFRDTVGGIGDAFLDPVNYISSDGVRFGTKAYDRLNGVSLVIGEYEDLKAAALDPYVAVKDAYHQNRQSSIKD